ncbi:MAG: NADH-quinone oxidoreductase subunit NuoF [Lentisphaerae bacterium]|nr:NADH-quinone oxidoreductase subunit NuoF [Lentisphaerota bacterium]
MSGPLERLAAARREAVFRLFERKFKARVRITIGSATCENAAGAEKVYARFKALIDERGAGDVALGRVGCTGKCDMEPVVTVIERNTRPFKYGALNPERAEQVFREHVLEGRPVEALLLPGPQPEGDMEDLISRCGDAAERVRGAADLERAFRDVFGDVHFFGKQLRLTLRNCGVIDPESLDEYLAVRGYEAAATVLERMTPQEVIETVKLAGLRGRGGGGFPTGVKWGFAAGEAADEKFIVCNADEGDPGAFMDRSTIEGDPHTVIEGLMIAGYAMGATQGFMYIRAEYPLAIARLERALEDARRAGFLGERIFGTDRRFDIEMRLGAGAFVCGEETALIHSIEGRRGMPRPRPPYPSASGLWGRPTVINNVETLANVPVIILDGAEWFGSIGTAKSKGTKVFALAGDVQNTGLVEVPMGTTLRDVVYDVGGGIKDGKAFKAVQTGGPAGGCLPASMLDTPVDYDTLAAAGSIMGSGGMIVMDEDTCMVNVARFFLEFTQNESCGKCTPCREGTKRMLEILTRITEGAGEEGDVEKLLRLADTIRKTSLCGLGQAAPNPVISTITHFRSEYDEHIREKRCAAGACAALTRYRIDPEACVGCGACRRVCPVNCITGGPKQVHVIDASRCIRCGQCFDACRFDAVLRG